MAKAEAYAARHAYGEVGDDTEEESDLNEEEIRRLQEATPDTRKKLKSEIDGDHTGKIGPFSTFFTLFKGFVATGVLFLPKGFASGGWFFTSFALVLCSILTIFASVKLVQTRLKHRVSFSEIGRKAFGLPGKIAVDFFLAVTQFLFVTAYIGFISGSVNNILVNTFKTDPINVWVIGAVCFVIYTPLCWVRKIEKFAFFHIFADIAIAIGLIVIMIYGTKNAVNNGFASDVELINNKTFLTAIGLAAYTFEGVGLIVPVMETTSRPDIYPHILSGVILLITFIYLFFGNWLYFSYGKTEVAKHPLVTDMLPADEIPIVIVDIVWIINLILTFPLVLHPWSTVIESYVFSTFEKGIKRKWGKNLVRTLLVASWVAIALGLRETLDKLESINGAFACIPLAFLLPVMFHYKLVAETKTEKIIDLAISALNFILMVMCSVLTFIYWSD